MGLHGRCHLVDTGRKLLLKLLHLCKVMLQRGEPSHNGLPLLLLQQVLLLLYLLLQLLHLLLYLLLYLSLQLLLLL